MKFQEVVEIESKRREIERLQNLLNVHEKVGEFGYRSSTTGGWTPVPDPIAPLLRETLCKYTVLKIVTLLDDCARLGVDTEAEKKVLAEYLDKIKPAPNA